MKGCFGRRPSAPRQPLKARSSLGGNQHRRVPHNVVEMIAGRLRYAHRAYRFRQLCYFHGRLSNAGPRPRTTVLSGPASETLHRSRHSN
jgi:hypothetical protein